MVHTPRTLRTQGRLRPMGTLVLKPVWATLRPDGVQKNSRTAWVREVVSFFVLVMGKLRRFRRFRSHTTIRLTTPSHPRSA